MIYVGRMVILTVTFEVCKNPLGLRRGPLLIHIDWCISLAELGGSTVMLPVSIYFQSD